MDDLFLVTYMKHPANFSTISTVCVCVFVCVCVLICTFKLMISVLSFISNNSIVCMPVGLQFATFIYEYTVS
jgi:hypothetical protein